MPYQQYAPYGGDLTAPGPTPAQIAQQREIANQLMQNQLGPIHANNTAYFSPWMGAANIARQLMGDVRTGYANRLQQQMQGQQGQQYGTAIQQMNPNAAPSSPAAAGPASSSFAGEPRGIRNNNPGNIEDSAFAKAQPGYAGSDGRFAIFNSPASGEAAMDKLLQSYAGRGLNTPAGIVNRWAPPSENNSSSYAATVAKGLGVDPNTQIDMNNPQVRQTLAANMATVENGRPYQMRGQQMAQGGAVDPRLLGAIEANPAFSEATKGAMRGYAVPTPTADVYGNPAVISPQGGARNLPQQGGFQGGFRAPVSVGPAGDVTTTVPQLPPGQQGAPQNLQQQLQPLVTMGQQFGQQGAANKAVQEAQTTDMRTANDAVQIRTVLRTMKDDLLAHGGQMVWGPTSEWVTNLKRALAQHAPGVLNKDQIEGLASADSFDKLSAQLQTLVGRMAGNTDLSLMQGHRSVPGSQNSQQGALALIDMLDQAAGINSQWMAENQQHIGQPGYNYMAAKREFFDAHKIVNPITRNPISIDLAKPQSGETKIINGKTYTKINGQWHEGM